MSTNEDLREQFEALVSQTVPLSAAAVLLRARRRRHIRRAAGFGAVASVVAAVALLPMQMPWADDGVKAVTPASASRPSQEEPAPEVTAATPDAADLGPDFADRFIIHPEVQSEAFGLLSEITDKAATVPQEMSMWVVRVPGEQKLPSSFGEPGDEFEVLVDGRHTGRLNRDGLDAGAAQVSWLQNDQLFNLVVFRDSFELEPVGLTDEEVLALAALIARTRGEK